MSEEKIEVKTPEKEAVEPITKKEVKKVIGSPRGGLNKRTLKELEHLKISLKDVFSFGDVSINLSWEKVIRLVNYNAGKQVLRWDHTFEEAIEVIGIFLM